MARLRFTLLVLLSIGILLWYIPAFLPYAIVAAVSAMAGCYAGFLLADKGDD